MSGAPRRDEGHRANGAPQDQTQADGFIVAQDIGERKELARLTAHAARGGFVVHSLASGGYLLGRWGHSRELPSLHALSIALRQMGVVQA